MLLKGKSMKSGVLEFVTVKTLILPKLFMMITCRRKYGSNVEQSIDDDCVAGRRWKRDSAGIDLGNTAGGNCFLAPLRLNFLPAPRGAVART